MNCCQSNKGEEELLIDYDVTGKNRSGKTRTHLYKKIPYLDLRSNDPVSLISKSRN